MSSSSSTAGGSHALANRRTVVPMPTPVLGSLRWPNRPILPEGNPCWTFMVEDAFTPYAVAVGHVENGRPHPFEVWVLGSEQPRCIGAVAKTLSADMRTQDRAWLIRKLDTLAGIGQGIPFELEIGGETLPVSSDSAVISRVLRFRLEQLGVLNPEEGEATPLVDAMMKTRGAGHEGTLSWTADVSNPSTGDDFTVFLPEVQTDDGQHRPVAVRLSGRYPSNLDGLAALLTMDMQIVDVAWIGMKLRKLLNYEEPMGSFFAKTPGSGTAERYPSIVAYLARLIIHRYSMLGLLTQEGYPVNHLGVMVEVDGDASNVVPIAA